MRITLGVVTSCFVTWSACASDLAVTASELAIVNVTVIDRTDALSKSESRMGSHPQAHA